MFKGVIPAVVTPFTQAGDLDPAGLAEVVEYLIASGVDGLFVCGSQGEAFALSDQERAVVFKIAVKQARGRVPVLAGIGASSTRRTLELGALATEAKCDACVAVTPFYCKLSQEELFQHYKVLTESLSLPVAAYNLPQCTGNALAPETVSKLASETTLVALKDSAANLGETYRFILDTPDDFAVLVGYEPDLKPALELGASGVISGLANVLPELLIRLVKATLAKAPEALELERLLLELRQAVLAAGNPFATVKLAARSLGIKAGYARLPNAEPGVEAGERLSAQVNELKERLNRL